MSDFPCRNPNCKSFGKPHPNCHCGPGGNYADGGSVMKENYCENNQTHKLDCVYFAEGGPTTNPQQLPPEDVGQTLGHAATHHGLLGIMKNVGHAELARSDKHAKELESAKSGSSKFGKHLLANDHEKAAEHMRGHPMIGNVAKEHLTPIVQQLHGPIMSQEPHPEALRSSVDYLHSSRKGSNTLDSHIPQIYDSKKMGLKPDVKGIESLKKHLDEIQVDPDKALESGGVLGHYMPDHATEIGSLTAIASNYFKGLKPMQSQGAPLDAVSPIDKMAESRYNRQLGIAQNPMLVLQHAKDNTLQKQDLMTLHMLYPKLAQSMVEKAQEQLIDAKSKGKSLTYKQKQGISMLIGQPLDSTMSQGSMQAIMQANGVQNQAPKPGAGGNQKATKTAVEESDKVNKLYQTPLQSRQINKKS